LGSTALRSAFLYGNGLLAFQMLQNGKEPLLVLVAVKVYQ
jgi:hypothetical protein